jgi:hypothetical protein
MGILRRTGGAALGALAWVGVACSAGGGRELPPAQQKSGGGAAAPGSGGGAAPGQSGGTATGAGGYVGCFVDQGDPAGLAGRDLQGAMFSSATMTVESCASSCAGFTHYGLENGTQCFCGTLGSPPGSAGCDMACGGNASEVCGGYWALQAYKH